MNASPAADPIEAPAAAEHVVDHRLPDELRQELVQHEPLVMPRRQPARLREHTRRLLELLLVAHVVDRAVVEEQERALQPGDDQVLVVARVGDDRARRRRRRGRSSKGPPRSTCSLTWSAGSYSAWSATGPAP